MAASADTGADYDVSHRIVRPNGEVRWISSRGQAFTNDQGRRVRVAGVSMDVTPEKRAERMRAALIELNDRFRDLYDSADISYAAAEVVGKALDVSRSGYGLVDPRRETITISATGMRRVSKLWQAFCSFATTAHTSRT